MPSPAHALRSRSALERSNPECGGHGAREREDVLGEQAQPRKPRDTPEPLELAVPDLRPCEAGLRERPRRRSHSSNGTDDPSTPNGDLIAAGVGAGFDAVVSIDQGADFERAISGQPILDVLLPGSQGSRLEDVLPVVESIEAALDRGQKGSIEKV